MTAHASHTDSAAAHAESAPPPLELRREYLVLLLVALVVMYGVGIGFMVEQSTGVYGLWALLSDAGALLFGLALLPVVLGVGADMGSDAAARATTVTGTVGAGALAAAAAVLVANGLGLLILPGALVLQFAGLTVIGAWFVAAGALGLRRRRWSKVAGWAAIVAGAGQIIGMGFTVFQLFSSPLFMAAMLANVAGIVTWAIALLRAPRVPRTA
ncbi:hypothetical protein [Microbacterium thalassium]|uniref:DUF308 domain-containing protein n=1 Tax=Microbacterium thalassium TaxID=362649 RepID=A0A7X0FTE6_9MICO|nr:hypothetical protein [Microbacterium thalassium]MBB6392666.1 hypothetical protein [Microbacterium thalassium]GLK23103.1 hypothetical protein GCM10017607_04210 [Microbacterium thalassium]